MTKTRLSELLNVLEDSLWTIQMLNEWLRQKGAMEKHPDTCAHCELPKRIQQLLTKYNRGNLLEKEDRAHENI